MQRKVDSLEKMLHDIERIPFRRYERIHPRRKNRGDARQKHIEKDQLEDFPAFLFRLSMGVVKNQAADNGERRADKKAKVRCQEAHEKTLRAKIRRNA